MKFAKVLTGVFAASMFGVVGCGAVVDETSPAEEAATADETATVTSRAITANPNVPYFADVIANGTGCPRGTWAVDLAPDGQVFTLTFSQYEATVNPRQAFSSKDCQIGIKLHSPNGLSYSVSEFFYSGYAFMDSPGMAASQSAKYYFQGNPVANAQARTALRGPYDDSYMFQDSVGIADLVWSPCGVQRTLNIDSRINVQNNQAKSGTGYVNTSSVNGSIQLRFRLSWRRC